MVARNNPSCDSPHGLCCFARGGVVGGIAVHGPETCAESSSFLRALERQRAARPALAGHSDADGAASPLPRAAG